MNGYVQSAAGVNFRSQMDFSLSMQMMHNIMCVCMCFKDIAYILPRIKRCTHILESSLIHHSFINKMFMK